MRRSNTSSSERLLAEMMNKTTKHVYFLVLIYISRLCAKVQSASAFVELAIHRISHHDIFYLAVLSSIYFI